MEEKKVPHPYHRGSEYNKPCSEYNKPLTPEFLLMLRGDKVLFSVAVVDFKIHILHLHHICKAFFLCVCALARFGWSCTSATSDGTTPHLSQDESWHAKVCFWSWIRSLPQRGELRRVSTKSKHDQQLAFHRRRKLVWHMKRSKSRSGRNPHSPMQRYSFSVSTGGAGSPGIDNRKYGNNHRHVAVLQLLQPVFQSDIGETAYGE